MVQGSDIRVAIACQGGGSHTAFTAGVLMETLRNHPPEYDIGALSGTSGGAMCAALAWDGLRRDDPEGAVERLDSFWRDLAADAPWETITNWWSVWGGRLTGEFGSFGVSPYWHTGSTAARRELRTLIERSVDFGDGARSAPPHLFVGAVDVESGTFEVFTDGDHGVDGLLASAAVPTIFRAVEIDGTGHWDGLFSQNPPIRHFTSEVPAEEKPDEIWLVRINPETRSETPRSLDDIGDRRNELAGNLSLNQELHMIRTINRLIDEGVIDHERYRPIAVKQVTLGADLDLHSKLNRDPGFLQGLIDRGAAMASDLWEPAPEPEVVETPTVTE